MGPGNVGNQVSAPLAGVVASGPGAATGSAARNSASYRFVMGFADMASIMGNIVGQPLQNEWYLANGDGIQMTTTGMMVWRKSDNWTAFTNGSMTWINGPYGVQERSNTDRFPWESQ